MSKAKYFQHNAALVALALLLLLSFTLHAPLYADTSSLPQSARESQAYDAGSLQTALCHAKNRAAFKAQRQKHSPHISGDNGMSPVVLSKVQVLGPPGHIILSLARSSNCFIPAMPVVSHAPRAPPGSLI